MFMTMPRLINGDRNYFGWNIVGLPSDDSNRVKKIFGYKIFNLEKIKLVDI